MIYLITAEKDAHTSTNDERYAKALERVGFFRCTKSEHDTVKRRCEKLDEQAAKNESS